MPIPLKFFCLISATWMRWIGFTDGVRRLAKQAQKSLSYSPQSMKQSDESESMFVTLPSPALSYRPPVLSLSKGLS